MKNFNPQRYGDFTRGEVILIIQLSAALQTIDEIINKFYTFTDKKKKITGSQVMEIQADFSTFIAKKSSVYLSNVDGNPLAHPRIILDLCLELYKECRIKTPTHSIKVADNLYETVEKSDLKTALAALKLAKDFQVELKKIKMEEEKEKKKNNIPTNAPAISEAESWEVDDQLNLEQ